MFEPFNLFIFGSTVVQIQHKLIYFPSIFWKQFWFPDSPVIFKVYFWAFILLLWQVSMRQTGQQAMQEERGKLHNERISSRDMDAGYLRYCHTVCQGSTHKTIALTVYCYFSFIYLNLYLAFHYREPLITMNARTCQKWVINPTSLRISKLQKSCCICFSW